MICMKRNIGHNLYGCMRLVMKDALITILVSLYVIKILSRLSTVCKDAHSKRQLLAARV